jgi:phosphatidylcholine synthase
MLALEAVYANLEKLAIVYLLITQLIDGIDGPMARNLNVRETVPKIDGYVLDLVIDFVTCVVVPVVFLHQFGLLPGQISLAVCGLVVLLSAIWFSRTDMMTEDNWFRGFPATWNLIVPTLYVMESTSWMNAALIVGLAVLMLTDVQFPHPVRVSENRLATLPFTAIWIGALLWGTLRLPDTDFLVQLALYASISYYVVLCAHRTLSARALRADDHSPAV